MSSTCPGTSFPSYVGVPILQKVIIMRKFRLVIYMTRVVWGAGFCLRRLTFNLDRCIGNFTLFFLGVVFPMDPRGRMGNATMLAPGA